MRRREFLAAAGLLAAGCASNGPKPKDPLFKISLAEWSWHRTLFAKKMDPFDFAKSARGFGLDAIEYVNAFFKPGDAAELKKRADGEGVKSLLIMCDNEGWLGDPDEAKRAKAVDNHVKWLDAAKALGCHSIRVNAGSRGTYDEQAKLAADGLRRLSGKGAERGLNVIVENHGGLSSNGAWLASVIKSVGLANCGTLPDFGNFRVSDKEMYDRYKGVAELMPFAKAVSAKSHDFDEKGNEVHTDYRRMMKIVVDAGYRGYVGIEYEGSKLGEREGIVATLRLLEAVRGEMGG